MMSVPSSHTRRHSADALPGQQQKEPEEEQNTETDDEKSTSSSISKRSRSTMGLHEVVRTDGLHLPGITPSGAQSSPTLIAPSSVRRATGGKSAPVSPLTHSTPVLPSSVTTTVITVTPREDEKKKKKSFSTIAPLKKFMQNKSKLERSDGSTEGSSEKEESKHKRNRSLNKEEKLAQFRKRFELTDEALLKDCMCALLRNGGLLVHGTMYISQHFVCFYSKIKSTKTKIPVGEIVDIKKKRVAFIVPNAIEIKTKEKKYFFSSFISRDNVFKFLVGLAKLEQPGSELNGTPRETDTETATQDTEIDGDDNDSIRHIMEDSSMTDDLDTDHGISEEDIEEGKDVASERPASSPAPPSLLMPPVRENIELPCEHYIPPRKIMVNVEHDFPLSVNDMYKHFFSDASGEWWEQSQLASGSSNFKWSKWQPSGTGCCLQHEIFFTSPIKSLLGPSSTNIEQTQTICYTGKDSFLLQTSSISHGVPFSSSFTTDSRWQVVSTGASSCHLKIEVFVTFHRSGPFLPKGTIEKATGDVGKDWFINWVEQARLKALEISSGKTDKSGVKKVIRKGVEGSKLEASPKLAKTQTASAMAVKPASTLPPAGLRTGASIEDGGLTRLFGPNATLIFFMMAFVVMLLLPCTLYLYCRTSTLEREATAWRQTGVLMTDRYTFLQNFLALTTDQESVRATLSDEWNFWKAEGEFDSQLALWKSEVHSMLQMMTALQDQLDKAVVPKYPKDAEFLTQINLLLSRSKTEVDPLLDRLAERLEARQFQKLADLPRSSEKS